MNLKKIKISGTKLLTLYLKMQDTSTSASETVENISLHLFISPFGVCIYVHYFFDVVKINKKISTRVNQKKIKSSGKQFVT